ncbi:hypothetical protein CIW83_02775 [Tissierella sp. P1]|uniref:hypothetical protein n=1 Tax=Tissierella sp. P1 TaxID=1280483 RepID=UPI000BA03A2C|nr:hypothetical protein [Tissierella sp. P1]OZV13486.1 hypothetical protein CIW83_02775 [Tissierella sp. P1]
MDWEVILMEPVVKAAIITVAGSMALATLGGFIKIVQGIIDEKKFQDQINSKIDSKIGNTEVGSLSKQHESLEKLGNMNKEQILNEIKLSSNNIKDILEVRDKVEETRYNNLGDGQKRLEDSFKTIEGFREEWKRVNEENIKLKEENVKLKQENIILNNKIVEYEDEWEMGR